LVEVIDRRMAVSSPAVIRLEAERAVEPTELSIGEVAAIVGIQPHTLRAWERRYRLVQPHRTPRNQRRYTVEDVALLSRIKETLGGSSRSIGRVAASQMSAIEASMPAVGSGALSVWRVALDLVPAPVLLLSSRGRIVDVNDAAARQMGMPREELRRRHFKELIAPRDQRRASLVYGVPMMQRYGFRLGLRSATRTTSLQFDCWPVRASRDRRLMVLVAR
jgi:PAS domain S-box-containing protein